jgi:acyl-coenzyme A thioesterase PaaI-like protein
MPNATKTMLDASEVTKLLDAESPQLLELGGRRDRIEAVGPLYGRLRLIYSPRYRRQGGTNRRPVAVEARRSGALCHDPRPKLVRARRDSMTIDFLRKPEPRDRLAECRMKFRKRLVCGTVRLTSEPLAAPVAHASASYSGPPRS